MKKHRKKIIIAAVAVVLAIVIVLTVVLVSCNSSSEPTPKTVILGYDSSVNLEPTSPSDNVYVSEEDISKGEYVNDFKVRTKVGYTAEYLGTVARKIPIETADEGLISKGVISAYPTYGRGANYTAEQKSAVINESANLCGVETWNGHGVFDRMDADGNLYRNNELVTVINSKLYKHSAAEGMYSGNVSDDEIAVVKRLTYMPRANGTSYNVTGLYAPAGEVIKVEMDEADMDATNGIAVFIGQALYNGKANNIWSARAINRMPIILSKLVLNKTNCTYDSERQVYTGYVGSHLGGPIYIYDERTEFSVTISGAVKYAHYIHGYTTKEEYEDNLKSSAPYFDLEVRENGVLHSGPKAAAGAQNLSYENIYDAAVLWEKISLVSTQRNKQGIVFLYDPFVAAGAAVAFPGQMSVNCPTGWMASSLNCAAFVKNGAWGNMHEYNHNFQGYGCGVGADGEVTNNALNLVEYSLFTKISEARQIGDFGGAGLGGWNSYTSATWALNRVNTGAITSTSGLAVYATLLHNFGQEAFIRSSSGKGLAYFQKFGEVTHHNMYYYTQLIKPYAAYDYPDLKTSQKQYPMFVPVSCVYQTGRSYNYDGQKKYITTMRPYVIKHGEPFDIDLNPYKSEGGMYGGGSIVIPSGFSYRIKKIVSPEHGKITSKGNNIFTFTPDENINSGKIVVTLAITKKDGAFAVEDVDLVLEFKQSHEMNKNMLERTIYTYTEETAPESAVAAYESNFDGAASKETVDNVNPVQNGNTEIWSKEPLPDNTFYEIKGKLHVGEAGKYRIALRGRWDCALYTAINKDADYTRVATIKTQESHANFYSDPETYHDFEHLDAGDWVYFKAILKSTRDHGGTNSYIGLGWGMFVPPQGVIDEDGNLIGSDGNIIENPQETITIAYANAYRASYEEIHEDFETDYFFLRDYKYTYTETLDYTVTQTPTSCENYTPWDSSDKYKIENMFDGNVETYIHSGKYNINADKPFKVDVELSEEITANRIIMYAPTTNNNATKYLPKAFQLWVSADGKTWVLAHSTSQSTLGTLKVSVDLDKEYTFKYYRLEVTDTHSVAAYKYIAISKIDFCKVKSYKDGAVFEADNEIFRYDGKWNTVSGLYTFGHIYEGRDNATLKFTFTGTAFAIFGYNDGKYGGFDVYIDGKKAASVTEKGETGGSQMVYLSDDLESGKHTVEIGCNNGTANIDNIVLWK